MEFNRWSFLYEMDSTGITLPSLQCVHTHHLSHENRMSPFSAQPPGYCMGYPRFGAIGALLLARLCIGTAVSWEDPKLHLLLGMLLAEVIEDEAMVWKMPCGDMSLEFSWYVWCLWGLALDCVDFVGLNTAIKNDTHNTYSKSIWAKLLFPYHGWRQAFAETTFAHMSWDQHGSTICHLILIFQLPPKLWIYELASMGNQIKLLRSESSAQNAPSGYYCSQQTEPTTSSRTCWVSPCGVSTWTCHLPAPHWPTRKWTRSPGGGLPPVWSMRQFNK